MNSASDVLNQISKSFLKVRQLTEALCSSLEIEDYLVQCMPDVSPPKWHLAHTSWFFEKFVLMKFDSHFRAFDPDFDYMFNSYYESAGKFFDRDKRGYLSRPTVQEVLVYRKHVTDATVDLLGRVSQQAHESESLSITKVVELGIHHEQQHQELLLTDIKYNFSVNPQRPAFLRKDRPRTSQHSVAPHCSWVTFEEATARIGYSGNYFSYDNECPIHRVLIPAFQLCSRLVTNGEYLDFMNSGGYSRPELWLSEGWKIVKSKNWEAPLYWEKDHRNWLVMTLFGMQPLREAEPVCHLSYYEADAFCRWRGFRLPTEMEWEYAAQSLPKTGNLLESENFHPFPACSLSLTQMYGDVWEWTRSSYHPYPGFKPLSGSLGEYNGKFMCNQMVLRGGSFATSINHIRPTYRNYFSPDSRWQFMGLRLASDAA